MASRDRDVSRKYESGATKRKRVEKRKDEEKKLSGSLAEYFKTSVNKELQLEICSGTHSEEPSTSKSHSSVKNDSTPSNFTSEKVSEDISLNITATGFAEEAVSVSAPEATMSETTHWPMEEDTGANSVVENENENEETSLPSIANFNVSDPFLWPKKLTHSELTILVKKGPVRPKIDEYPSTKGRHFSDAHYIKSLINGEKQDRRWLVYSETKDAVFCFACRLFHDHSKCNVSALGSFTGVNDWKHLKETLKSHENAKSHKEGMIKWLSFQKRLFCGKTIDSQTQAQADFEQKRWKDILERLLAIVQFLARHNLAFRGHEESLNSQISSGNFLDLVKLMARFDPILREHLHQAMDKDKSLSRTHYLSKTTQNELIEVMAIHVRNQIVDKIKKNKYFSIILDCTRDISRVEQMSIILRTTNQESAEIEEHFLEFVAVDKTTAEKLTEYIINKLEKLGLSIADCRGQGYDNGANMRGEKSGVQRRLLNLNPLAFFVPCGCHSWNLILGDAASSCPQAQTFFGILQRLYTIFSCSSERWNILKSHVTISLKPLSETRWECRSESVKAVRYQLSNVCDALSTLREKNTDCGLISECQSLENEIASFEFVVSLVIWYDILVKIHTMSKVWQSVNMQLDVAVKHIEAFVKWLDEYRDSGFQSALVSAGEVAEEVGITRTFKTQRRRCKKRMFDYEQEDEVPEQTPEDNFRINYFLTIVDAVQASCKPRFSALKTYKNSFGFLYHLKELCSMSDEELMKNCVDLRMTLSNGDNCDIDELEIYEEIKMLTLVYDEEADNVLSVLKYIVLNNLKDIYPNIYVALRIIATIPVTVASAERSFSKLKLIKTYLRNTMTQDRLSYLALLSIENDLVSKIDFKDVIEEFSQRKSRRVKF